jgi:hypothetical protein
MKAVQYTKQIIKKSIHLVYATCTNDVIIYSKQASNIELFIVAFFIEYNRLFIADTALMNAIQKEVLGKLVTSYRLYLSLAQVNWIKTKNVIHELFVNNNEFVKQYNKGTMLNQ